MRLPVLTRLLTLLLGMCYLGGVCELDAKECKQNYAKESHDYLLAADAHDGTIHVAPQPAAPDALLWPVPAWQTLWAVVFAMEAANNPAPSREGPPPRPRLYLRHSVLQV